MQDVATNALMKLKLLRVAGCAGAEKEVQH
jgi:hypothetical protein